MSGRPINSDRQNAIALELKTYTGAVHRRCGTTERYVAGGGCVHCARIIATEQRDARKYMKAQRDKELQFAQADAAGFGPEMQAALEADGEKLRQLTNEDHGPYFVVDSPEEDGLEKDDAEARRQAAIDELL